MTPYYRIFCSPADVTHECIDIDDKRLFELLRRPPRTRDAGWVIWGADEIIRSDEGLQAIGIDGRRLFVFKNGHMEYWEPCLSDTFQWSQNATEQQMHPWLYPYAICELPINFLTLANKVYELAGLDCDVTVVEAFYHIKGFILMPYRPRSLAFIQGGGSSVKPYGRDILKTRPVKGRPPFQPEHTAFELVKQVYHEFGYGAEDIYLFDEHGDFHPGA